MAKGHNSWAGLTPEQKAAKVKRMLATRNRTLRAAPKIIRPAVVRESSVTAVPDASLEAVVARLIVEVAKLLHAS